MGANITFREVSKTVKGNLILRECDISMNAGEIAIIIGPSGAGKSTTLRLINRLCEADSGDILIDNCSIRKMEATRLRRQVGFISQVPVMFEGTVFQNVIYGLTLEKGFDGQYSHELKNKIIELLELSNLDASYLNREASKLSIGEQQRVAIARALMLSPEILLMDEPTSALDPQGILRIEETIKKINLATGTSFVIVTHSPNQAVRLGQRIFWLCEGRLREIQRDEVEDLMKGDRKEGLENG